MPNRDSTTTKLVLGVSPLGQSGNCHQPSFFTDKTTPDPDSQFLSWSQRGTEKETRRKKEGNRVGAGPLRLVRRTAKKRRGGIRAVVLTKNDDGKLLFAGIGLDCFRNNVDNLLLSYAQLDSVASKQSML